MNSHICVAHCMTLHVTPKTSKQKGYFSTHFVPQFVSKHSCTNSYASTTDSGCRQEHCFSCYASKLHQPTEGCYQQETWCRLNGRCLWQEAERPTCTHSLVGHMNLQYHTATVNLIQICVSSGGS